LRSQKIGQQQQQGQRSKEMASHSAKLVSPG
jgi:hypothetical protein